MNIGIVSQGNTLYSTLRLKEAAEARGHSAQIINYLSSCVRITPEKPGKLSKSSIHIRGEELGKLDAIIPRIAPKRTAYGTAFVRQCEIMGIYSVNSSIAITRSRDKLRAHQLLTMKGIDIPTTGFANTPDDVNDLIDLIGKPPLVIKLIEGTQGIGVVLAETKKAAESVIQTLMGLNANIIVQEFIKEAGGEDIRCFVIGDKVVAAMQRKAPPGDFRANIHRGGAAELIKITKAEREIAVKAAKTMGLHVAGVDLIRSERGPLILEINSSPGLEGIEAATQKDIAGMIIEYIEKNAKPIGSKTHYHG